MKIDAEAETVYPPICWIRGRPCSVDCIAWRSEGCLVLQRLQEIAEALKKLNRKV